MDDTMNTHLQAAHALLDECLKNPFTVIFPTEEQVPGPQPVATPLLIEGQLEGHKLAVTMPNGETWLYTLVTDDKVPFKRCLLVCIHHRDPSTAACFRPTGEGIHPFLGVATRYGVERSVA